MINGVILIAMIWAFVSVIALAAFNPNMSTDSTNNRTNHTTTNTNTSDNSPVPETNSESS